jgi:sugar fermentation stimulation protein A
MSKIYQYPPLLAGKLIKRYKRFLADIQLASGEIITAHCPNTGPMTGVSTPGSLVQVSQSSDRKRKLPYTWEMIEVNDSESTALPAREPSSRAQRTQPSWVGVNTALPNRVVKLALEQRLFPELVGKYKYITTEVKYGLNGQSRVDFLLTGEDSQPPIYLEVKSVTLAQGKVALFPDTVTTRGQKHLRELMALIPKAKPVMLYFINRGDCVAFAPGDRCDPVYGELLREAVAAGVEILPYCFEITPHGIYYLGRAEFLMKQPVE